MTAHHRTRPNTSPSKRAALGLCLGAACSLLPAVSQAQSAITGFGTTQRLFSINSPWNLRPVGPVLGTAQVPTSDYYPAIMQGMYSTGIFVTKPTDLPVTVLGPNSQTGLWDPDLEQYRPSGITLPRWPADTLPASGSDGHAEVIDTTTGIVHSFWQLKNVNGQWRAALYSWSPIDGRGWGNPAHYFQGARASGVPAAAGIIRKHEVNDGDTRYRHALAMSLTFNGMSANPTHVFPATASDWNASTTNTGGIPMGSLVMLPKTFNVNALKTPELRKIAWTLMSYGAYVVDRNYGTPFVIFVENGAALDVHRGSWNNTAAAELHVIRAALRPLQSASHWVNSNNEVVERGTQGLNLVSMRGNWELQQGGPLGQFDTWQQAIVFPPTTSGTTQQKYIWHKTHQNTWAQPVPGQVYTVTARTTGGATVRFKLDFCDNGQKYDSGDLANAQTTSFVWPGAGCTTILGASTGPHAQSSSAGLTLTEN